MADLALFKGIAVVIDDEVHIKESGVATICAQIHEAGGYVVALTELPASAADFTNFGGAAFFVLDWNLLGADLGAPEAGVRAPAGLKDQHVKDKIDFLKKLRDSRLAPVFVFTHEDVDAVKAALHECPDLYVNDKPSHIFVMSKQDVIDKGVLQVLNEWVLKVPSALALRLWEVEYEKAKNSLFADFYSKSIYWPAFLWQTFEEDGVPGSDELGRLISRNLLSRMTPFEMDMATFVPELEKLKAEEPAEYRRALLSVLEGERFVRADRLHQNSVGPGDVFKEGGKYYLNIRPDCDCAIRKGNEDPVLYLLKGNKLRAAEVKEMLDPDHGLFKERDDQSIVFAMDDGANVAFRFKDLHQKAWSEMKDKRVGRLLPPFSTRIQQRYSAYLQRAGLPKIPKAAMPDEVIAKVAPAAAAPLEGTAPEKAEPGR
jgi:hypothetical protein